MAENMNLPKNIRQMGMPTDKQKVYIEDYVYTYLHSFLKEKYRDDTLRAAVVLGEYYKEDEVTYTFVKGAVACDFSQLHEEMSQELTQTIRNYFPGWDMLGWYVSSQGVDAHIQSEIKHHYASCNVSGPQYLVYEDELERDIQVFAWEQNALHYLNGYYIYYEKNPRMQEFLIMEKGGRPQEIPTMQVRQTRMEITDQYKSNVSRNFSDMRELTSYTEEKEENKSTMENHRKRQEKRQVVAGKEKRPQRIVYAACAAVLAVLVAMGISQMGSYQNLKQLQETISNTIIPVWRNQEEPSSVTESEDLPEEELPEEQLPEQDDAAEDAPAQDEMIQDMSVQDETKGDMTPTNYVVKKGDSLIAISRAIYENEEMVLPICELNDISNFHLIFEGQNLKLP